MKHFNSFILVPLLVFTIFIFSSCTNTQPLSKNDNTATNQSAFENKNAVSQDIFENDLHTNPLIINCHSAKYVPDTPFSIVEYTIDKRKIDEDNKTDTIYCTILLDNTYLSVSLSATFFYSLYDVGGWLLDTLEINQKSVQAIAAPDVQEILHDLDYSCYSFSGNYSNHKFDLYYLRSFYDPNNSNAYSSEISLLYSLQEATRSSFFGMHPETLEIYQFYKDNEDAVVKQYLELPTDTVNFDQTTQTTYIQFPRKTVWGIVKCNSIVRFDGENWVPTQNYPHVLGNVENDGYFDSLPYSYYAETNYMFDDIKHYQYTVTVNSKEGYAEITKTVETRSASIDSYNELLETDEETFVCDIDFVRGCFIADDREFYVLEYADNIAEPSKYYFFEMDDGINEVTYNTVRKVAYAE